MTFLTALQIATCLWAGFYMGGRMATFLDTYL